MTDNLFDLRNGSVVAERLRLARELRGITQSALAASVKVDQTMIAHIERGAKEPNVELLETIARELQLPSSFFWQQPLPLPKGSLLFRAKAGATKRALTMAHARAQVVFELIQSLSRKARLIPVRVVPSFDSRRAAEAIRASCGQPRGPFLNLLRSIEKLGVIILALPPIEGCDAFAVWAGNSAEIPVVALSTSASTDRLRFTAAHELGHLLLHRAGAGDSSKMEREAYEFAAELLMPSRDILPDFHAHKLNIFRLAELKGKWQVSIQALARRARDLNVINERQYRYLMRQLSIQGWRMQEPCYFPMAPEHPRLFTKMLDVIFGKHGDVNTIAAQLHVSPQLLSEVITCYDTPPARSTPTAKALVM